MHAAQPGAKRATICKHLHVPWLNKILTRCNSSSFGLLFDRDKDSKQRLKLFDKCANSITASAFDSTGQIFAYAMGYDWSKGVGMSQQVKQPCGVMLHPLKEEEIKNKPKK